MTVYVVLGHYGTFVGVYQNKASADAACSRFQTDAEYRDTREHFKVITTKII